MLPPPAPGPTKLILKNVRRVTDLQPTDTEDNPYFYTFKVQCTSCRETHPNWVTVNRHETNDLSGSRGEANFVWKCKNCKRESSASIKAAPAVYAQQSPAKAKNIVEFDCRGLEFVEFKADVGAIPNDSVLGNRGEEGLMLSRVNSRPQGWTQARSSRPSISATASGLTTTRRLERR
jgi:hypothetical protein